MTLGGSGYVEWRGNWMGEIFFNSKSFWGLPFSKTGELCAIRYMCMYVRTYTHVWQPEVKLRCHSTTDITQPRCGRACLWGMLGLMGSHLEPFSAYGSTTEADWPENARNLSISIFPSWNYQSMPSPTPTWLFTLALGWNSCPHVSKVTSWAMSHASKHFCLNHVTILPIQTLKLLNFDAKFSTSFTAY